VADETNAGTARGPDEPTSRVQIEELPFASLGDRLLAQAVDGLMAMGIFFLVGMSLAGRFGGLTDEGFNLTGIPALIFLGIMVAVMLGYFILTEGYFGMTLGKVVSEIRVANREGGPIGMRASLIRNLMRLIDGFGLYLVGAFSVILTTRRVRLGDLAAGTVVISHRQGRLLQAGALVLALLLAAGGVWGGFSLRGATSRGGGPISASLAPAVSSNYEPINPTTTFSPQTEVIYVAFRVSQAAPGSRLKAVWTAVNVGAAAPANSQIAESTLLLPGPSPGSFRFRRGPQPWPSGDYQVSLYLNDLLVLTIPYKVSS
jgi:uncharacterized RDD family membrane protein YckC